MFVKNNENRGEPIKKIMLTALTIFTTLAFAQDDHKLQIYEQEHIPLKIIDKGKLIPVQVNSDKYTSKVKVKFYGLPKTIDLKRIQSNLDHFNKVFSNCHIELESEIQYEILSDKNVVPFFTCGTFSLGNYDNLQWKAVDQKLRSQNEISIFYLEVDYNYPLNKINLPNSACAWNQYLKAPIIYMSNINRPIYKQLYDQEKDNLIFSHEMGHILFQEGHNEIDQNLMRDASNFAELKRRGENITVDQCLKAKKFIKQYQSQ